MHYSTLVAVNLPQIQEDLNGNKQARLDLERLQNLYDQSGEKIYFAENPNRRNKKPTYRVLARGVRLDRRNHGSV